MAKSIWRLRIRVAGGVARANGKPRGRPPHKNSKAALPMPGDEQVGGWSQAQLIRMDHRFRARLLRAFESGKENRQAAAATYHAIRALERALRNGGEAQEAAGARLSELRRDGMKRECTLPHMRRPDPPV